MKFVSKARLKDYILSKLDEATIFAYYLDADITNIYKCINNPAYRVLNKHRGDQNPSFGLQYYRISGKTKLWGKDFASPEYTGDCFHYASIVMNLNCNMPEDFVKTCTNIIRDLIESTPLQGYNHLATPTPKAKNTVVKSINIKIRDLNAHDIKYWNSFGITIETLNKEKIFPVNQFYIDDNLQNYEYYPNNPAYAYYLGNNPKPLWEIYRPNEVKHKKFRTNNTADVKELYTIIPNTNLILTKSKKDKALINQILSELNVTNTSVLYTSESNRLKQNTITLLNYNYKNIYVNFDLDRTGIESMKYFNKEYKFSIFPFTSASMIKGITKHPKDITDFSKRFGYENTKKIFNQLYSKYVTHG